MMESSNMSGKNKPVAPVSVGSSSIQLLTHLRGSHFMPCKEMGMMWERPVAPYGPLFPQE